MPQDNQRRDQRQDRQGQGRRNQQGHTDHQDEHRATQEQSAQKEKESVQILIRAGGRPLVDKAERLGPEFQRGGLTTNQIRNIYGMVKQMEMNGFDSKKFILFKPKLAYAAARAAKPGAYRFRDIMTWAIEEVGEDKEKFERFVDFFEAILAYHKAAGGK